MGILLLRTYCGLWQENWVVNVSCIREEMPREMLGTAKIIKLTAVLGCFLTVIAFALQRRYKLLAT
jgi:hypothetical protein